MQGLLGAAMVATLQIAHAYPGALDRTTEIDLTPSSAEKQFVVRHATYRDGRTFETVRSYGPSVQKDLERLLESKNLLDLKSWPDDSPCPVTSELWIIRSGGSGKKICRDRASKNRLDRLARAVIELLKVE